MRALCYMMAFGADARACAELAIRSFRTRGEFGGDVLVISDATVRGATLLALTPDPVTWQGRNNLRAYLDHYVANGWDWYWYTDCDVMALRRLPWERLSPGRLNWCRAATTRFCDSDLQVGIDLTPEEKTTDRACNAGVCFFDHDAFSVVLTAWQGRIESIERRFPAHPGANQTALNSLVVKRLVPAVPLDDDWVHFAENPASASDGRVLRHWASGLNMAEKLELMR